MCIVYSLFIAFFLLASGSVSAQQTAQAPAIPQIQPEKLVTLQADTSVIILDTRSPAEYREGHLRRARFVNFETFELQQVADIPKDKKIVVYCKAGGRSMQVAGKLKQAGYIRVKNLEGGITRWQEQGYKIVHE